MSLFDRSSARYSFSSRLSSSRPHRFWLATLVMLAFVFVCMAPQLAAQTLPPVAVGAVTFNGITTTVNTGSFGLVMPQGLAVDGAGDLYITNGRFPLIVGGMGCDCVVEVTQAGVTSELSTGSLTLSNPTAVALDGAGDVYIADYGNSRVVEVTAAGAASVLSTGSLTLNGPMGVAVNGAGNVYIADYGNNRVVEVTAAGVASVLSTSGLPGTTDGENTQGCSNAGLCAPYNVAVDGASDVYIVDRGNSRLVKLTAAGVASVMGTGSLTLSYPTGVAVDGAGNIYVADYNNQRIVEVTAAGAANALNVGTPGGVTLGYAFGIAVDSMGDVYATSASSEVVLEVSPSVNFGLVAAKSTATANQQTLPYTFQSNDTLTAVNVLTQGANGKDYTSDASTTCLTGIPYATGDTCNVVVDLSPTFPGERAGAVQLVDANGTQATTYLSAVGQGPLGVFQPGVASVLNIGTPGGTALSETNGVAIDGAGNVYIADTAHARVVEVTAAGVASVLNTGSLDISAVQSVAVDGAGNVYIPDYNQSRIVEVTAEGVASVLSTGSVSLKNPYGVTTDGAGDLYVTDLTNNCVVKVTAAGAASVLNVGTPGGKGLNMPTGVAVDNTGNVYIADSENSRVVEVTAAGVVSVLSTGTVNLFVPQAVAVDGAGTVYISNNTDIVEVTAGVASKLNTGSLTLTGPAEMAVDGAGDVYIADYYNSRVVEVNRSQQSLSFAGMAADETSGPQDAIVENIGNKPLVFTALDSPTTGQTTSSFNLNGSDTNCTNATSLAAGESCILGVEFAPLTLGSLTGAVNITDNNLNAASPNYATQSIALSGVGLTATTTSLTAPANSTFGASVTLTATVLAGTTPVTSGTVTFYDGSASIGAGTVNASGVATLNLTTLPVGVNSITANYGATTNDAASTSSASTVTVTADSTTTSLTAPASSTCGASVTLTATVLAGATPVTAGTVTFCNGSASIGTGTLNASGVATLSLSTLPLGVNSITAG